MNAEVLVVQGPGLANTQVDWLAGRVRATRVERGDATSARLHGALRDADIAAYCAEAGLDWGYVAADARFADFRLVAMDMDSTLITIECIDEIADMVGIKPEVAAITTAAMRGEIEFRESLARRVALLAGLEEAALARVYDERLQLSPGADALLERCRDTGAKTLLVSGGFTFFTDRLKARLGLDYTLSNVLAAEGGRLAGRVVGNIVDAQGKAAEVRRVREALGLAQREVLVLGDGANDLAMMAEAGVSIAYRAKPVVRERASYALSHVGLDGVLRLFR
jgi:phosphoserine phosphatase